MALTIPDVSTSPVSWAYSSMASKSKIQGFGGLRVKGLGVKGLGFRV